MSSYYTNSWYRINGALNRGVIYNLLSVNNNARNPEIPFLPLENPLPVGDLRLAVISTTVRFLNMVQPVKISPMVMSERVMYKSSLSFAHISPGTVLTKAGVSSQVLFNKIQFGTIVQKASVMVQGTMAKLGDVIIGSSSMTLKLMNTLGNAKRVSISPLTTSVLRMLNGTAKRSIVTSETKISLREVISVIKISLVGVVSKQAVKEQSSIVKIAPSQIQTLLRYRGSLDNNKRVDGVILTILKNRLSNNSGKVALVIVSTIDQALQVKQAVTSNRISSADIVSQVSISTIGTFERVVLGDILTTLGIRFDVISAQAVAVALDPCTGDVPAGLALVNRLENDFIDFTLCGGQDRFVFEESAAYSELKKRGLL